MIITIPQSWINECESFALECAQTNLARYKTRGQASIDKIVSDIYVGKMGEVAVYLHKMEQGIECTAPDFAIYKGRKKSYDADLNSNGKKVHVKTQSKNSAKLYGISWILQCKEGDKDKLFKFRNPEDVAVLCVMHSDTEVEILAEVSIDWLFEQDLIEEPRLKWFIGVKKALYWENIKGRLSP